MRHDPFMTEKQLAVLQDAHRTFFQIRSNAVGKIVNIKTGKYAGRPAKIYAIEFFATSARILYYATPLRRDGKDVLNNVPEFRCKYYGTDFDLIS